MKINDKNTVSVPVEDIDRYLVNMSNLLDVHFNLIELFRQEDKLKKHHRPYLHVREQIEATIEKTTPIVLDIAAQLCADMEKTTPPAEDEDPARTVRPVAGTAPIPPAWLTWLT